MSVKVEWQDHKSVASEAIVDAFTHSLYTDVTIAAGDKFIKCHRMVLSYFSSYFRNVFVQAETSEPNLVIILIASPDVVEALISFMYHGTVSVDRSLIPGLRQLAENLGIPALMNLSDPPPELPLLSSRSSRIIDAAEALQAMRHGISSNKPVLSNQMTFVNHNSPVSLLNQTTLFNPVPQSFQTVPRQPESQVPGEQPMAGISPASKTEDPMDRDSNYSRYHASGCRNNEPASAISPPLPTRSPNVPPPLKKRKLSDFEPYTEDQDVSPNSSGLPNSSCGEDDADSRDSDGELQIVVSPESQSTEDQSFPDDSEPQDLRVEPKPSTPAESRLAIDNGTPNVNSIFSAGNLLSPFSVTSSISRLYSSSGLHEVTIQPAHSNKGDTLSSNTSIRLIENNSLNSSHLEHDSNQRRNKLKCPVKRLTPKQSIKKKGENSTDKSYTPKQLADSVMAVIKGGLQPVEAINQYGIPRRTFFRRLLLKRTELGIATKSRSKPSSRSGSPKSMINASKSIKSPESSTDSVSVLSNALFNTIPTSGTQLHAMLKNMSSAGSSDTLRLKVEDGASSDANSSDFIAANLQVEVKEEVGDVITA